jgi:hypothetical protein
LLLLQISLGFFDDATCFGDINNCFQKVQQSPLNNSDPHGPQTIQYIDPRYPGMQATNCISIFPNYTKFACSIQIGQYYALPVFNHYGHFDGSEPSRPKYCDCKKFDSNDLYCNAFVFLSGFLTYNYPDTVNGNDINQLNIFPMIRLYEKFNYDFSALNKAAYNATLHRSQKNLDDGNYYSNDFDFCYDSVTNSYCTVISFLSYPTDNFISKYQNKLSNGFCSKQFSMADSAW